MKRTLLTLAVLFTTVLANASEHLDPVLRPDTEYDGKNYLMMGIVAMFCICVGVFALIVDKNMKKQLKNKN